MFEFCNHRISRAEVGDDNSIDKCSPEVDKSNLNDTKDTEKLKSDVINKTAFNELESDLDDKYNSYISGKKTFSFERRNSDDIVARKSINNDAASDINKSKINENLKKSEDGLIDSEKKQLKEKTNWPDKIVDSIRTPAEADIYIKANLKVSEVDGKQCLIRSDIDMEQKDEFGRTNKERMELGISPYTNCGEKVELHHIGQKQDSPLAELTTQEHRGKGNDAILHDKQKESEIDRIIFSNERQQYWKSRSENI